MRLEQLLQETAFPDEVLDGSNQYHCPRCDRKVNARKTTKLSKLPPYLHITVERYMYDFQKEERRRLAHPVSFPRRLELRLGGPPLPAEASEPSASSNAVPGSGFAAAAPALAAVHGTEAALPVAYECVGYLEHVSDSAHSGHYVATLLQTDEEQALATALLAAQHSAEKEQGGKDTEAATSPTLTSAAATDEQLREQPPAKRAKICEGADAAAGSPRNLGKWWRMDDETITPVTWSSSAGAAAAAAASSGDAGAQDSSSTAAEGGAAGAASTTGAAPERIESTTAYLILYRRCDHEPGQLVRGRRCSSAAPAPLPLPEHLANFVATHNEELRRRRSEFLSNSKAVERFTEERLKAIHCLADALRAEAKALACGSAADFSFVPTSWLERFLRGEDRNLQDLLEGDASVDAPIYGRSLIRGSRNAAETIDPLAVWCGEVKLLPTAALEAVGALHGGLDASLLLQAEGALSEKACEAVWNVFKIWCNEQRKLAQLMEGSRLTPTEARALESQGCETVFVSTRVCNHWKKVAGQCSGTGAALLHSQWRGFLEEVGAARWGSALSPEIERDGAADEAEAEEELPEVQELQAAPPAPAAELLLLDGLLCCHSLICKPRAAVLFRRAEVCSLMEVAAEKERAYKALWPEARPTARPRLRSGLPEGRMLGINDVCTECKASDAVLPGARAEEEKARAAGRRLITVRRKFTSGSVRKQGTVTVPVGPGLTAASLRTAVQEQLKMPVLRLWLPSASSMGSGANGSGDLVELKNEEAVGEEQDVIIVEKGEEEEREGAAFNNSVFLMPSNPAPRAAEKEASKDEAATQSSSGCLASAPIDVDEEVMPPSSERPPPSSPERRADEETAPEVMPPSSEIPPLSSPERRAEEEAAPEAVEEPPRPESPPASC